MQPRVELKIVGAAMGKVNASQASAVQREPLVSGTAFAHREG
jgi:hypothetical protein